MKIVIPNYAAPDSFVDNVTYTLRAMGHEVKTMPPRSNRWLNSPVYRYASTGLSKLYPDRPSLHEQWLLKTTRSWKPDMILGLTQSTCEAVLAETRHLGVPLRVAWWGDTPANMKRMSLLTHEWDAIFIKDPHGVQKLRLLGLNASLLHEAMNPVWHRPLMNQSNNEIVIAGTFYGYRQALTSILIDHGIEVGLYGGRLPRWVKPTIRKRHTKRFIVREDKSRIFGAGLACLNSTALSEGNSLNCRAFEIAGAGGLQLLEHREIVSECFEPGIELLTFESIEELLELIARAHNDPAWANKIREAGARRARAEHTYRHRLDTIFNSLN